MLTLITIILITLAISIIVYWLSNYNQWDLLEMISAFIGIFAIIIAAGIGWYIIISCLISLF